LGARELEALAFSLRIPVGGDERHEEAIVLATKLSEQLNKIKMDINQKQQSIESFFPPAS